MPGNDRKRVVYILGLNHSGTTIFWRAFRKNKGLLCFDEPFTGDLGVWFPNDNEKRTFGEYIDVFGGDVEKFKKIYAPISPFQELDCEFTEAQRSYLNFLLGQGNDIVIDETHLHQHLPALLALSSGTRVIHLHRRASTFVTSHMRPSWSKNAGHVRLGVRWMRNEYNKARFWSRKDILPGMCRGDVIGDNPTSRFGTMLHAAGYDAKRIMASSAVVRLLAYWHYYYHHVESEGRNLFGEKFRTLRYEEFATNPQETMTEIYRWLGMDEPVGIVYSDVHPPKPPFRVFDVRWRESAKIAGFSDEEVDTLL